MSDEHAEPKATLAVVQRLVNELADKVDVKFDKMDDGIRQQFSELRAAIESLRDEIPTRRECQYRHEEVDAAITAAVQLSEADRQKIWDATHAVEAEVGGLRTLVYKGVGAAAVLSIIFGAAVSAVFALLVA